MYITKCLPNDTAIIKEQECELNDKEKCLVAYTKNVYNIVSHKNVYYMNIVNP